MDAPETSSATTSKSQRNNHHQQPQQLNRQRREFNSKTHSLNKRPISKPIHRKCDIYVSNKSNFQVNSQLN